MTFEIEDRSAFSESVPVYVEASGDTYRVVDVDTGEIVSEDHASPRAALNAALKLEVVASFKKRANLRTDGEPDGEWRWLDATAVEDEPIGGARIGERAIWEMAQSLNTRASAIPVNGGGAPEGLGNSEPHGDAKSGGDHLANGYAHVGIPVAEADGRAHLYLYGELLPEVAAEVDRGRLAYGSVYFGFDDVDPDDNEAVLGAVLISHALTNDPAVTTLTAGSERRRAPSGLAQKRAARSRWSLQMSVTIEQLRELHATATDESATPAARFRAACALRAGIRGVAADKLGDVAGLLGLTAEEVREDHYKISDAVWALIQAVQIEEVLEANAIGGGGEGEVEAERPALTDAQREKLVASAKRGLVLGPLASRAVEGMEGEALDEWAMSTLDSLRKVFDKPEAPADDVLSELQSREDELMALVADDEEPEEGGEGGEDANDAGQPESVAASMVLRMQRQRDSARTERNELRAKVALYETREWLDAELAKREKSLPKEKRERYVAIAIKSGRETVEAFLDDLNMPPQENPLDSVETPRGEDVRTAREAYDACEEEAERELVELEAKRAARERRQPRAIPRHEVRARAQQIAAQRYPEIVGAAA